MAIKTINKLPVYEALVTDDETGMMRVSLVDAPAVDSDFIKLAKDRPAQMYRVENEERHLVRGVIMRADYPLFRRDDNYGEYYVIYRADTIRRMAEKYLAESRQNDVNVMHEDGSDVEGVRMVQWFIKDTAAGISPEGFGDIEDGSLFAEYHVTNADVWDSIKDGTYKGFSLEGVFSLVPQEMRKETFNNEKIMVKRTKLSRIMAALAKAMLELGSVTTDKGILVWDGDEDLKAGDEVFIEDSDGNRVQAEAGDYRTSDNKTIKVADGKVSEIVDPEAEVDSNFGSKETDNGVLEWDGEEDLRAGDSVYVQQDGERVPAPDGDYRTTDGKVIRVKDGKVEEIVDDEAEVAGAEVKARSMFLSKIAQRFEKTYEEKTRRIAEAVRAKSGRYEYSYIVEAADDYCIVCWWEEDTYIDHYTRFAVTWNGDTPALGEETEVKPAFVPVNDTEREEMRRQIAQLSKQVEQLMAQPMTGPAEIKASENGGAKKTGNKGLDRLAVLADL